MKQKIASVKWIVYIFFTILLILNFVQYEKIQQFKQKQYYCDVEFKASIQSLIFYLNNPEINTMNNLELKEYSYLTSRINYLLRFSSYSRNDTVRNCFTALDYFFVAPSNIKENSNEIGDKLQEIINNADKEKINLEACLRLYDYIRNK